MGSFFFSAFREPVCVLCVVCFGCSSPVWDKRRGATNDDAGVVKPLTLVMHETANAARSTVENRGIMLTDYCLVRVSSLECLRSVCVAVVWGF